jgi:hypothetical protein
VIEKAEAHGGSLRSTEGTGGGEGCITHVVCVACVVHPFRPVRRPGGTRGAFAWQPLWGGSV